MGTLGTMIRCRRCLAELVEADLLILLSDIEGMYTADPKSNPNARFIHTVVEIDEKLEQMAGGSSSDFGTGGMANKSQCGKSGDESRGRYGDRQR